MTPGYGTADQTKNRLRITTKQMAGGLPGPRSLGFLRPKWMLLHPDTQYHRGTSPSGTSHSWEASQTGSAL